MCLERAYHNGLKIYVGVSKGTSAMELYRETSAIPLYTHASDRPVVNATHLTTTGKYILQKLSNRDNTRAASYQDELKQISSEVTDINIGKWILHRH